MGQKNVFQRHNQCLQHTLIMQPFKQQAYDHDDHCYAAHLTRLKACQRFGEASISRTAVDKFSLYIQVFPLYYCPRFITKLRRYTTQCRHRGGCCATECECATATLISPDPSLNNVDFERLQIPGLKNTSTMQYIKVGSLPIIRITHVRRKNKTMTPDVENPGTPKQEQQRSNNNNRKAGNIITIYILALCKNTIYAETP